MCIRDRTAAHRIKLSLPLTHLFLCCCCCCTRAVDEMGVRIDELENSIGELMAQAGIDDEPGAHPEGAPPPSQPAAQAS